MNASVYWVYVTQLDTCVANNEKNFKSSTTLLTHELMISIIDM